MGGMGFICIPNSILCFFPLDRYRHNCRYWLANDLHPWNTLTENHHRTDRLGKRENEKMEFIFRRRIWANLVEWVVRCQLKLNQRRKQFLSSWRRFCSRSCDPAVFFN